MELAGKQVLVIGCGKSGIGAAAFLLREGACPVLFDENETLTEEAVRRHLAEKMEELCADAAERKIEKPGTDAAGRKIEEQRTDAAERKIEKSDIDAAEVILRELPAETKEQTQLLVISPGVPVDSPLVEEFRGRGIPVWGEIELAYRKERGQVIAITGTNGKTTTTTLLGEIMKRHFAASFVMGNIGFPYADIAGKTTEQSVTVGEISSFQLETIERFHPKVSVILNITPDHLNRHHTMENYIAAKNNITKNQTADDTCILNYDNAETRKLGEHCPAKVRWFSVREEVSEGVFLRGEELFLAKGGEARRLMNIRGMRLVGLCNVENVMAAILASEAIGVSEDEYLEVIREFKAVEHRIEFVEEVGGVAYYNDSKGTNPDAAIQAIFAMERPTVLIGGGYDKGSSYDEWVEAFEGKVKRLVLIGQTKEKIADCAREHGFTDIVFADTFAEAFEICVQCAEPGDAVLLSPACASWGMFPNYEERGRLFKELVRREKENAAEQSKASERAKAETKEERRKTERQEALWQEAKKARA